MTTMRISVTGSSKGFTLVELMVVMTLIALMSAAVIVAMPDPRGSVTAEAERFAARAKAAQERAITDARGMAIRVTGAGYGFDIREKSVWRPLSAKPFVDSAWNAGTQAAIEGADVARITFDPTGISEPARVDLVRDGERASVVIAQDGSIDVVV